MRMHEDEIEVPEDLVRRLVDAQLPRWAGLPLRRVASTGTVHALYRLGDDKVVRLPLTPRFQALPTEMAWLPKLAPHLPLPVPEPLVLGEPTDEYPFTWAVFGWVDGETWAIADVDDPCEAAERLAAFVHALRQVDAEGGPPARDGGAGGRLAGKERGIRWALGAAKDMDDVDCVAIEAAWRSAVEAPEWDGPPVWVHGDLLAGNVLTKDGRLHAVIDWGSCAVGDPAVDLLPTWSLFEGESSAVYRAAFPDADEAMWLRASGYAVSRIVNVPYYARSNPRFVVDAKETLGRVLRDLGLTP